MANIAQRSHQLMLKLAAHFDVDVEDLIDSFEGLILDQIGEAPQKNNRNNLNDYEIDLLRQNQKIKAVKSFKDRTGLGLRECVEILNTWQRQHN